MVNKTTVCCLLFLSAIVTADLSVTYFGTAALPFTAFFLIPFDLVTRDILHEEWKGNNLVLRMFLLVVCGGVISFVLNFDALRIALASVTAFSVATGVNTLVYHLMRKHKKMVKMNTSNFFAAISDSLLFPSIAFGVLPLDIIISQSTAKFAGGFMWSALFILVLSRVGKHQKFK